MEFEGHIVSRISSLTNAAALITMGARNHECPLASENQSVFN